jgi:uncharacterized membrane protein
MTAKSSNELNFNTKQLVISALFVALSFVGANIKVFGTIAFDSLPAFLGALLFGPAYGAAIGFLGHLFTAITSGFPLSVPLHLVIALTMALTMYGYGFLFKKLRGKVPATVCFIIVGFAGTLLNGPVSLAFSITALAFMANIETALGLLTLLPALTAASIGNIVLSIILFKSLEKIWKRGA